MSTFEDRTPAPGVRRVCTQTPSTAMRLGKDIGVPHDALTPGHTVPYTAVNGTTQ